MLKRVNNAKGMLKATLELHRLMVSGLKPGFFLTLFDCMQKLRWVDSVKTHKPIDATGAPCPWYTFSALHFLSTRKLDGLSVFEYGSGNSTLWWSRVAGSVTSVEHDRSWFDTMRPQLGSSTTYIHRELVPGGDYCRELLNHERSFDVIVIDGRDRVNCAKVSLQKLAPHTVIIWDNSDRDRYEEGYAALIDAGFRRLDFFGFGPVNGYPWMTSIFYRDGNCLGI